MTIECVFLSDQFWDHRIFYQLVMIVVWSWIPDVHWMCVCVCVYVAGLASDCNNKLSKIMNDNDLHSRASDELTFLVSQLLWMTAF